MPIRITIERILRDEDDAIGQSIREWKIEVEDASIMLRGREKAGFVHLRANDILVLIADLERAKAVAGTFDESEPAPPKPATRRGRKKKLGTAIASEARESDTPLKLPDPDKIPSHMLRIPEKG